MSNKETIGDGWAVIRSADEVPERLRRAYLEAQAGMLEKSGASISEDGEVDKASINAVAMTSAIGPVKDALILAYVQSWSREEPLAIDSVMDLPGGWYDELHRLCEAEYKKGGGGVVAPDPADVLDPNSPTGPLAVSGS